MLVVGYRIETTAVLRPGFGVSGAVIPVLYFPEDGRASNTWVC